VNIEVDRTGAVRPAVPGSNKCVQIFIRCRCPYLTPRSKVEGPSVSAVPQKISYGENMVVWPRIRNIDSRMEYRSTSFSILCGLSIKNLSIYAAE
jgi:hypothetical protein